MNETIMNCAPPKYRLTYNEPIIVPVP